MSKLDPLLHNNKKWTANMEVNHPVFFNELVSQQRPKYVSIGCSNNCVPANEIIGLPPGEVFGHRNVTVQVTHVRALEPSSRIKRVRVLLDLC